MYPHPLTAWWSEYAMWIVTARIRGALFEQKFKATELYFPSMPTAW